MVLPASCTLYPNKHPGLATTQVPIFNIMRKFDGVTITDDIRAGRRKFRVTRLPRFLCLHMKRFTKVGAAVSSCACLHSQPMRSMCRSASLPNLRILSQTGRQRGSRALRVPPSSP